MFEKLILFKENKLEIEESILFNYADSINLKVDFCSMKQMERNKIELNKNCLVCGPILFVKHALRRLGKELPEHIPYPSILSEWLSRKVKLENKLKDVLYEIEQGKSLFIKPAKGWKKFTGFVCEDPRDHRLSRVSKNIPVWISTPIAIRSEWRVYVSKRNILGIRVCPYSDENIKPDTETIQKCLQKLYESGQDYDGFVIDFGVTNENKTVLIEMNDGFSFGNYGISGKDYFEIISNRWKQLIK